MKVIYGLGRSPGLPLQQHSSLTFVRILNRLWYPTSSCPRTQSTCPEQRAAEAPCHLYCHWPKSFSVALAESSTGSDSYLEYLWWEACWDMTQTPPKYAGARSGLVGFLPRSVGALYENRSRKSGRRSFAPDLCRSVWLPDFGKILHAQIVSQH